MRSSFVWISFGSLFAIFGWIYYFLAIGDSLHKEETVIKKRFDEATESLRLQLSENPIIDTSVKYSLEQFTPTLPTLELLSIVLLEQLPRRNVSEARRMKTNRTAHTSDAIQPSRYLCTSFIGWKREKLELLRGNVEKVQGICDWLLIVYDSPSHRTISDMREEIKSLFNSTIENIRIEVPPLRHHPRFVSYYREKCQSQFREPFHRNRSPYRSKAHEQMPPLPVSELVKLCEFIDAKKSRGKEANSDRLYPKVLLFLATLDYLADYDYLWLLDDDLDLQDFDFHEFLSLQSQGVNGLRQPPLVSQPLINESKPYFPYLSVDGWQTLLPSLPKISLTGYVEIQAPLIETHYLRWYILSVVVPMFQPLNLLAVDWGFDDLLCRSSYLYAFPHRTKALLRDYDRIFDEQQLKKLENTFAVLHPYQTIPTITSHLRSTKMYPPRPSANTLTLSHCAVVIGDNLSSSLIHRNHRDILKKFGSFSIREVWSTKMRSMLFQYYPHFYLPGIFPAANPFYPANPVA